METQPPPAFEDDYLELKRDMISACVKDLRRWAKAFDAIAADPQRDAIITTIRELAEPTAD